MMHKPRLSWALLIIMVLLGGAITTVALAQSQPQGTAAPPGIDLEGLDGAAQTLFREIAEEQFCPCGRPQSFWDSMNAAQDCPVATRLGNGMAADLRVGKPKRDVVKSLLRAIANINARFTFDTSKSPRLGDGKAKIEIVVFSDFECPYCRRAAEPLTSFARRNADTSLVYKFYPIAFHTHARAAALAALAAGRQGKFWEMHDAIYDSDTAPTSERLDALAKRLELDVERWKKDMGDAALAAQIDADTREGDKAGIQGTPTIFVNGLLVDDLDALEKRIAEERKNAP